MYHRLTVVTPNSWNSIFLVWRYPCTNLSFWTACIKYLSAAYDTIRIIVLLMRSKISSIAASGNRDKDGMRATASSTRVSVITKFINAATSNPWSSNSSPSSVSLRNDVSALHRDKRENTRVVMIIRTCLLGRRKTKQNNHVVGSFP